jgi:hypothetical protein
MMGEPAGEPLRAEYGSPFIERQVALRRLIEEPEEISEFASGTANRSTPPKAKIKLQGKFRFWGDA